MRAIRLVSAAVSVFGAAISVFSTGTLLAQSAPAPDSAGPRVFNFSAVYSAKKLFEGTLTVQGDSMAVSSSWGKCTPDLSSAEPAGFARFKCSGVTDVEGLSLSFERATPTHATWTGVPARTVAKVMMVCGTSSGTPSRASGCARESDIPVGKESKTPPTITDKLKVSEKTKK